VKIDVVHGSILDTDVQVIVNAANSLGLMGGGVAGAIKRAAGTMVEREAVKDAPIRVGKAILTSGGNTKFKGIIHAPTMPEPGMHIPVQNVALATRAALTLADEKGFESVAIPGMGTGVGGVAPAAAAKAMTETVQAFVPRALKSVILVDVDEKMVAAWKQQLGQ
jgi:O-acetyl-ADP-ribose deacetylase (regulator of RNase III)